MKINVWDAYKATRPKLWEKNCIFSYEEKIGALITIESEAPIRPHSPKILDKRAKNGL